MCDGNIGIGPMSDERDALREVGEADWVVSDTWSDWIWDICTREEEKENEEEEGIERIETRGVW